MPEAATTAKKTAGAKKAAAPKAPAAPKEDAAPASVPVHRAWANVMADVQSIGKDDKNEFQGFNFRGIDAVMNAVGPILRKHGVIVVPTSVTSQHRDYSNKGGGLQHEAIVYPGYTIIGPEGDSIQGMSIGEASDTSDKATSQAMSVAYRTFLLQSLTIPTGDPDPDHNTVERPSAADEAAMAAGWANGVDQAGAWNEGVSMEGAKLPEVVAWARAQDPPLSPSSLTREQYGAWVDFTIATLSGQSDEDATVRGTETATAEEVAGALDEAQSRLAESLGAEEIVNEGWPEGPVEFAKLDARQGQLSASGIDQVQKWRDTQDFTPETITKANAKAWFDQLAAAGPQGPSGDPAPANDWWTDLGWASMAELQSTHRSLLERHTRLSTDEQRDISAKVPTGIDPAKLTKAAARVWLAEIDTAEQEPF